MEVNNDVLYIEWALDDPNFDIHASAVRRACPVAASLHSNSPHGIQASKLRQDEILKLRLQACPLRKQHRA